MKAWNDFLKEQERELGADTVKKWLSPLRVISFDACNLHLEAKDAFQALWFEEHILKKSKLALFNNNQSPIKIHLKVGNASDQKSQKKRHKSPGEESPAPAFQITFDTLDPLATFDYYVETESTLLAYKLLCKITNYDPISQTIIPSHSELASFNPIFLYGGEGCGKTHLLTATAHALKSKQLKVVYVTADTFTQHVVTAIRSSEMGAFRLAYRNIDVLLIDDAHLFSKRGATQEELFHTFNTLHLAGKQIILAANCAPSELQNIEPRLVSRFEWGIVLPLDSTLEKDVLKILKKKCEALNISLHPSVEEFLVHTFPSNLKTLNRALETLVMRHHLNENKRQGQTSPLNNLQTARLFLKDLIQQEEQEALTPEKIVHSVAEYFGIKEEDVFRKGQSRESVLPRQLAMYFCRSKLNLPFKKIGEVFSKDHSTVMSSVKAIQTQIAENDKEILTPYVTILKKINK